MQSAYASDIDDILKNLESPEVDYHVDSEIKTIVLPQPEFYPAIKPDLRTKFKNQNNPNQVTIKKTNNQQKDNTSKPINKTAQKSENKANIKTDKQNTDNQTKFSDSKENNNKTSLTSVSKSEIKKETAKTSEKKQNSKVSDKTSKPIKIYSLFLFFKDMKVTQNWVNGIKENLEFFKSFSQTILVFWQQKVDEDEDEEEEEEDADENEEDEGDFDEEEEKKIDFSKYNSIIAKGEELYTNKEWDELQKLVEENPDASEAPAMQKFKLMLELNKKKPNVNQIRNYADNLIKENPNSPEANYGLAYFYYYNTKKRNIAKATKHIKIATQGKNPLKEAVNLSNEISKSKLTKIVVIVLISILILSIIVFVLFKKLKARKKNKQETTDNTNQESLQQASQKDSQSSANTAQADNQIIQTPTAETAVVNNMNNNVEVEEIIEEVIEEPQSDAILSEYPTSESMGDITNTSSDNQVIVEEIIEEVEEPKEEIVEEIIEEVEEPEEEIVEEIIEEIEDEPEEEIIEEIIEEEEDYSDDIDSISEEALLTE